MPTHIIELARLPSHLFGEGKVHQSLSRWKKLYKRHGGEDILLQETRGTGQSGPYGPRGQLSLEKVNARIAYLEGNLELVKKLELHERSMKNDRKNNLNKQERFELIYQIIRGIHLVTWLIICVILRE